MKIALIVLGVISLLANVSLIGMAVCLYIRKEARQKRNTANQSDDSSITAKNKHV